jgi:hypothetical protein
MTQQMGSASGTAPASRGTEVTTEVTPGRASELTSGSMTDGGVSGGAPGLTEADWQEPGSAEPAGPRPAGPAVAAESADGSADGKVSARIRNWLRRTPPATADVAPVAPSVVAAGPELDLASG